MIPMKLPPSPAPINGQKLCEHADQFFGWCHLGHNGCVLLAIYNALLLCGRAFPLGRIHRLLHRLWRPRFFGVRVHEIRRCLKKLKVPYTEARSVTELEAQLQPGDVAIIMRWNRTLPFCHFTLGQEPLSVTRYPDPFGGAHGVAVQYEAPGRWIVYNRYSNRQKTYVFPTFMDYMLFDAAFMAGFILKKSLTS